jgi:very-short-patch-repair endonuclease
VIFHICAAEGADAEISGRPAAVFQELHVDGTGEGGLARVAAAQRALVCQEQLYALGYARGAIGHRRKTGLFHRFLPGVVSVGHPVLDARTAMLGALLYAGEGSVLSHGSAAAVWGLAEADEHAVQVTSIGRHVLHAGVVRAHQVPMLDLADVTLREGLPVTDVARALIDFAAAAEERALTRALAEAQLRGHTNEAAITAAMDRCPGRSGIARLRRLLADPVRTQPSRSELERTMIRLLRRAGLPLPEVNVTCCGRERDFVWETQRLVVEVDGYRFHGHREAFESDRQRDQELAAGGYRVMRVTWRQLTREPMAVAVRLAQALAVAT